MRSTVRRTTRRGIATNRRIEHWWSPCAAADDDDRRRRSDDGGDATNEASRRFDDPDQAPTAVGHAGPVRRLLLGHRHGASTPRRVLDVDHPRRSRRHRPADPARAGAVDFGIAWVPKALVSREEDAEIIDIGQVFQRSGTLEVSWADAGITRPRLGGKNVGTWGFGNEFELFAAWAFGPDPTADVTSSNSLSTCRRC